MFATWSLNGSWALFTPIKSLLNYMNRDPFMSHVPSIKVNAEKVKSGPDGLFVINALSCQQSCAANPDCKKFTWKRDTTPMKGDSVAATPVMSIKHVWLDFDSLVEWDGIASWQGVFKKVLTQLCCLCGSELWPAVAEKNGPYMAMPPRSKTKIQRATETTQRNTHGILQNNYVTTKQKPIATQLKNEEHHRFVGLGVDYGSLC